jgi:hypothetical protein
MRQILGIFHACILTVFVNGGIITFLSFRVVPFREVGIAEDIFEN